MYEHICEVNNGTNMGRRHNAQSKQKTRKKAPAKQRRMKKGTNEILGFSQMVTKYKEVNK